MRAPPFMVDPQIVQIKHLAKHTPLQIHPDPKKSIKINRKLVTNGGRAALRKLRGVTVDALPPLCLWKPLK